MSCHGVPGAALAALVAVTLFVSGTFVAGQVDPEARVLRELQGRGREYLRGDQGGGRRAGAVSRVSRWPDADLDGVQRGSGQQPDGLEPHHAARPIALPRRFVQFCVKGGCRQTLDNPWNTR